MASVGSDVQPFQVFNRGLTGSAVLYHPPAKLFYGLQIEVGRLGAYPFTIIPQVGEIPLDLACRYIRPVDKLTADNQPLSSRHNQFTVLICVALIT